MNCVLPGAVNTEFNAALLVFRSHFSVLLKLLLQGDENQRKSMVDNIPAGRLAEPKDIIGTILFYVY